MKYKGCNSKSNERKKVLFLIYLICILLVSVTTTTYAYLEYYNINSQSQELASADLTVTISKVKPSNNNIVNLIPLSEEDLGLAVSDEYNCRDNNDFDICHIYKIDVTNSKELSLKADGFLDFEVNGGEVTNLKYKLMESATTLGTNTSKYANIVSGNDEEIILKDNNRFVKEVILDGNTTKTYYVVVWIEEIGSEQLDEGNIKVSASFRASSISSSTIVNYLVRFRDSYDTSYFHDTNYITAIKNAYFVNYIDISNVSLDVSDNEIYWDMSEGNDSSIVAWLEDCKEGYYNLYIGCEEKIYAKNLSNFFRGMTMLENISFDNLDTSFTTNMGSMFLGCSNLISLDLSSFDTSNVTSMVNMFNGCSSLIELDLSSFYTSNISSMLNMFRDCNSLVSLDLSSFDTSNVTDMSNMFNGCNSLISLDLSGFYTGNVTNMGNMFGGCSNLVNLDLRNFDTTNVTKMTNMFRNAAKVITSITIRNTDVINTTYVTIFTGAATVNGAGIVVNYISSTSELVDNMLLTKSSNSNVIKGSLVS